jgi:hypothetical protein
VNPRRYRVLCCIVAGTLLTAATVAQQAIEATVKAAYLVNFLNYVEWPAETLGAPGAPLVVGVAGGSAGADAVMQELRLIVPGRVANGRPIQARMAEPDDSLENVHAVYVPDPARHASLLRRLRGSAVLVVTDGARGLDEGGMLNFVPVNGRIRFEAAPALAERVGLKLGARLLGVAERVVPR